MVSWCYYTGAAFPTSPNVFLFSSSRPVRQGSPFEKASVLTQWQLKWQCQLVSYCGWLCFSSVLAKKAQMPIGMGQMFVQNSLLQRIQCYSASGIEKLIFTCICSAWNGMLNFRTSCGQELPIRTEFLVHVVSHGLPRRLQTCEIL